jgi:FKBP-type peptidyl-prolyl cis-trans isomerase FkpA
VVPFHLYFILLSLNGFNKEEIPLFIVVYKRSMTLEIMIRRMSEESLPMKSLMKSRPLSATCALALSAALLLGGLSILSPQADARKSNEHKLSKKGENKLEIEDVKVGTGEEAVKGKTVAVNYLGTLNEGGKKFDSSYDRNEPIRFKLGAHQVIEGWEQGIAGMKVGGKRILIIPPAMGYGATGYPPVIPGNATLRFEVELVGVE